MTTNRNRDKASDETKKVFADRLSDYLDLSSDCFIMTAKELSKNADISEGIISQYRNAKNAPSLDKLKKIACVLNVSCDQLLGISDVKTPDVTTQEISKRLGLSEDVQNRLAAWMTRTQFTSDIDPDYSLTAFEVFNHLLISNFFESLLFNIHSYCSYMIKHNSNNSSLSIDDETEVINALKELTNAKDILDKYNSCIVEPKTVAESCLYHASTDLKEIAEEIAKKGGVNNGIN